MGLWVCAGSWSMSAHTDGFIPLSLVARWGTKKDAERLVRAGLWSHYEKDGEEGYLFHDWLKYQPDARTMRLKQEAESVAGSKGNHLRWHVRRKVKDPECGFCEEGETHA